MCRKHTHLKKINIGFCKEDFCSVFEAEEDSGCFIA